MSETGDLFEATPPAAARPAGWPDFNPHEAVRRITRARTAQLRLELLAAVPRGWQRTMLHFVVVRLAAILFDAQPGDRRALSQEIPPEWLDQVRAHYGRYVAQAIAHAALEAARKRFSPPGVGAVGFSDHWQHELQGPRVPR